MRANEKTNNQSNLEQFENYELKVKTYSQKEILSVTSELFIREKKISDAILILLAEIQNRRIYADLGFTSLFELLTRHFKLSESTAYQKVSLIKLIREVPEAKAALVKAEATVSNLVLANTYINEQKKTQNKLNNQEKKKIVELVKDKSFREAKQELARLNPETQTPRDKTKILNESKVSLSFAIDRELQEKLTHIKNLISHQNPNPTMNELLTMMADITIAEIEKKKGFNKKPTAEKPINKELDNENAINEKVQTSRKTAEEIELQMAPAKTDKYTKINNTPKHSRYISKHVKREVYERAGGQCQYVSPEGRRCECKSFLQFEHVQPFSCMGTNEAGNLKVYCSSHNYLAAKKFFGKDPREYKR
jgi:hypothetical protein